MSAVLGGTASALGGGKFANGAISGAFSYMLNQASNKGWGNDPDGKYTVENSGDLEGKKIVGVAILDEYLAGQATATDKGGIGHSGLTVISKKVKDLNVKLAINGEAVALVVVRTFNGYKQFMIDHASMVGNVRYAALFTHAAPGSTFSNPIHQFKYWSRGRATFDPQGPISWDSIMASSSIQTQYMNSFTCGEKLLDASGLFDETFGRKF